MSATKQPKDGGSKGACEGRPSGGGRTSEMRLRMPLLRKGGNGDGGDDDGDVCVTAVLTDSFGEVLKRYPLVAFMAQPHDIMSTYTD